MALRRLGLQLQGRSRDELPVHRPGHRLHEQRFKQARPPSPSIRSARLIPAVANPFDRAFGSTGALVQAVLHGAPRQRLAREKLRSGVYVAWTHRPPGFSESTDDRLPHGTGASRNRRSHVNWRLWSWMRVPIRRTPSRSRPHGSRFKSAPFSSTRDSILQPVDGAPVPSVRRRR